MSRGRNSLVIKADDSAVNALLSELGDAAKETVRPAAQAGADVLYQAVLRNVQNQPYSKTGNLKNSIYQVYSEDNSNETAATYHVSWNARKAPHGHLVEYGYKQKYKVIYDQKTGRFWTDKTRPLPVPKQIPAYPFVRPAQAFFGKAMDAAERVILQRMAAQIVEKVK